jgi:phytol kinase
MINAWLGIGLYLALLLGLLSVLRAYQLHTKANPEVVRKLLHIGMGFGTLPLPWVFRAAWPVLLLSGVSMLLMLMLRRHGWLRAHFGGVLDGVARRTAGEFYFAVGAASVFLLSNGAKVLFVIPVLLLTLADSSAALVGLRFGRFRYPSGDGEKSLEGSLACCIAATLCTFLPLRFSYGVGLAESLLIGVILGLLVMLLEAVSWGGTDNVLIPVVSWLLLINIMTRDVTQLGLVLIVLIVTTIGSVSRFRIKATEGHWMASVERGVGEG